MPQYYSLIEEIYDLLDIMKNNEDKWVHRIDNDSGATVWKIGKREFEEKYNPVFEDMVRSRSLIEIVSGKYKLSEEGEKELREYSKINT